MKKTISITGIIYLLLPFIVNAQEYEYVPFPDSGAVWSEMYIPHLETEPIIYERFTLNGEDTIINTVKYKKIYLFYDSVFNKSKAIYAGALREDGKKIFYKCDSAIRDFMPSFSDIDQLNNELLLYDFTLKVGDTLHHGNIFNTDEALIVDEIDTILIGGKLRKRFIFNTFEHSTKWIEGIGNIKGLLFTSSDLTGIVNNYLICYKYKDSIIYNNQGFGTCYLGNLIKTSKSKKAKIIVSPNPAISDKILIEFGNFNCTNLQIIDFSGSIIDNLKIKNRDQLLYHLNNINPGIYLINAIYKNGANITAKFIVN